MLAEFVAEYESGFLNRFADQELGLTPEFVRRSGWRGGREWELTCECDPLSAWNMGVPQRAQHMLGLEPGIIGEESEPLVDDS